MIYILYSQIYSSSVFASFSGSSLVNPSTSDDIAIYIFLFVASALVLLVSFLRHDYKKRHSKPLEFDFLIKK